MTSTLKVLNISHDVRNNIIYFNIVGFVQSCFRTYFIIHCCKSAPNKWKYSLRRKRANVEGFCITHLIEILKNRTTIIANYGENK